MSQTTDILQALKSGRSLTPLDALSEFGCYRLAARIEEIRQQGHDVATKLVKANGKRFARYSLNK